MGLGKIFGTVGAMAGSVFGPIGGMVGGALGNTIGGALTDYGSSALSNTLARSNANAAFNQSQSATALAFERNKYLYQNRYQWAVEDMKKAGLNPILAASGGFSVGSSPSVQSAQAFQANNSNLLASQSAKNFAETDKIENEAFKISEEADKIHAEIQKLMREQVKVDEETEKLIQESKRIFEQARMYENVADAGDMLLNWVKRANDTYEKMYQGVKEGAIGKLFGELIDLGKALIQLYHGKNSLIHGGYN
jgi:hypothetical protein